MSFVESSDNGTINVTTKLYSRSIVAEGSGILGCAA